MPDTLDAPQQEPSFLLRQVSQQISTLQSTVATKADLQALEARMERFQENTYSRTEVDLMVKAVETGHSNNADAIKLLEERAFSAPQRYLALIGSGLGILAACIELVRMASGH